MMESRFRKCGMYAVYKAIKPICDRLVGTPAEDAIAKSLKAVCTEDDVLAIWFSNNDHRAIFEEYVQADFEKNLKDVYDGSLRMEFVDEETYKAYQEAWETAAEQPDSKEEKL